MRADRLLSLLMLLQARGRMTAEQLASELEVSVRTVYRDIDALSGAGVPVYTERGPGGGCALVEGYRTRLTGLTRGEVRALFALGVPEVLEGLGMSGELRQAVRKLAASLPEDHRRDEAWVRQRIHLDWSAPGDPGDAPHLPELHRAVREDRRAVVSYSVHASPGPIRFVRTVDPYGLVAQAGVWHLVCAAGGCVRIYRVVELSEVQVTEEHFARPGDFDLPAFWEGWSQERAARRLRYPVTMCVSPDLVPMLPLVLGEHLREAREEDGRCRGDGWITLTVPFERLETARTLVLGMGRAVEVLAPESLRQSVIDFARQIVDFYS